MGASARVAPFARTYLRISLLGAPFVLVALAGTGYLRGLQDTRTPLVIALAANALNLALELVLVYGIHLGIAGSAWGTVIAQIAAALAYLAIVRRNVRALAARRPGPMSRSSARRARSAPISRSAPARCSSRSPPRPRSRPGSATPRSPRTRSRSSCGCSSRCASTRSPSRGRRSSAGRSARTTPALTPRDVAAHAPVGRAGRASFSACSSSPPTRCSPRLHPRRRRAGRAPARPGRGRVDAATRRRASSCSTASSSARATSATSRSRWPGRPCASSRARSPCSRPGAGLIALWGALVRLHVRPPVRHGPPLQRECHGWLPGPPVHRLRAVADGPERGNRASPGDRRPRPHPDVDLTDLAELDPGIGRELVPLARPAPEPEPEVRRSDVDRWGRSEHFRALTRRVFDPHLQALVPRRVGGIRAPPRDTAARCSSRTTPARSRPTRRRSCTASRRISAGPCTGSRRTSSARCRSSARCGRAAAASPRIPTTRTGCCTTRNSSCSCSPRARREPASSTPTATGCAGSGGAASSRSRCAPGVPVIPIAVMGAEETMPILFKSPRLAKALNLPYFPVTANMLAFGPAGIVAYLPAKFRIRVLPPVYFDVAPEPGALLPQPRDGRVGTHPPDGAGRALRHAAQAAQRVVRVGGTAMRALVTGLSTYWGGRVAQALEQRPTSRSSSASTRAIRALRSSAPSSCAPTRRTRSSPASCARRRSTPSCTRTSSSTPRARRAARLHEINVIGTMNLLAAAGAPGEPGAQGRAEELRARVRREQGRPVLLPRGHGAHRAREHAGRTVAARSRRRSSATSPTTTRTSTSACSVSRTCSASTSTRRSPPRCAARSSPRSSASIRACSSSTKTTSSTR